MKKVFMVCMLVLLATLPAFSADNYAGVITGPSFFVGSWNMSAGNATTGSATVSYEYKTTDFLFGVRGANFFTEYIGIGYGIDLYLPISVKLRSEDYKDASPAYYVDASVGVQGKYDFTSEFALEGGVGISYQYGSRTEADSNGLKVKLTQKYFKLYADFGVSYSVLENLLIRGGLRFATPVTTSIHLSNVSSDFAFKQSGAYILPYVGIAYAY